jgi:hypothetical protein
VTSLALPPGAALPPTRRCSVRSLLLDVPALRAWALLASPVVILEHPPSLPPPSDIDEHTNQTLSKK